MSPKLFVHIILMNKFLNQSGPQCWTDWSNCQLQSPGWRSDTMLSHSHPHSPPRYRKGLCGRHKHWDWWWRNPRWNKNEWKETKVDKLSEAERKSLWKRWCCLDWVMSCFMKNCPNTITTLNQLLHWRQILLARQLSRQIKPCHLNSQIIF